MLWVERLTVRAGEFTLRDVSLHLEAGECGVVVGPSGAGKSTLLEAMAGLREVERGRILLGGAGHYCSSAGKAGRCFRAPRLRSLPALDSFRKYSVGTAPFKVAERRGGEAVQLLVPIAGIALIAVPPT